MTRAVAARPTLFGAAYSVYVRMARLALVEKGVDYRLVEVDVFAAGGVPPEHLARHPFGRIPAFEHDGFRLYESAAIERYVDEAFDGPLLQPPDAKGRARLTQIVGVIDAYAYRTLVWDIFVERVRARDRGREPDEPRIAAALPKAELCLRAIGELMGEGPWLCGPSLTLADLHAAPVFAYFTMAPEGRALLAGQPALSRWWDKMASRPSMAATRSALEDATA